VYVRAAADAGSAEVGSLETGQSVEIVKCTGDWCEIVEPAGFVWRGCTDNNPDGLKCEVRE
jgi:SH3-like domain-containing protein